MRSIRDGVTQWTWLMLAAILALGLAPSQAAAQTKEGWAGWASPHTANLFATPDEACRSQWQYYNGNPKSRYIGAFLSPGGKGGYCSWTQYQYLCPEETGGGITSCGTTFPTWVELRCAGDYQAQQGECVKSDELIPERPCNCNNGGAINPQVGDPIVLSTGAKVLTATDYASADGDFVIGRSYRSMLSSFNAVTLTPPIGLAGGWTFDFAYEVQFKQFGGTPSSPYGYATVVAPDGTAYDFVMQPGGSFTPFYNGDSYRPVYATKDFKLEFVGTLPSDLTALNTATSSWRLTDRDDTVWTLRTFTQPNTTSPFSIARPTSRVKRGGYQWNFTYGADDSLQTIADSFGRQATFHWSMFNLTALSPAPAGSAPYPEEVDSVSLPDGTSLRYSYDPPPAAAGPSTAAIRRLVKVERLNASSAAIDSTGYAYGDARFPKAITAVTDFSGDLLASYSYDGRGRGASTSLANNAESYTVAHSVITGSNGLPELVKTVTTPLGKTVEYHFKRYDNGVGGGVDLRFASIVSTAGANTPASTSTVTYGTDNFIATETDEEGRVTSYTRDSKGRPTMIVEASGTPQAKTTTIVWDASFNVPDQIVQPGLQTDFTYYPDGQLHTKTETDTTVQTVPYSTNGQTRTWTFTWTSTGRLLSLNGPKPADASGNDDTITFAYDAAGNLQTSTDGLGHVTSFSNYDANGHAGTVTDPNNVATTLTYDGLGRTKTITFKHPTNASLDATTSFDYDVRGNVNGIMLPSTEKLFMDYNAAGQLTSMRAASGERRDFAYDADGNVASETVKRVDGTASQHITRSFDELSRLLTESVVSPNTSQYGYDKVGNLTGITTPKGNTTTQGFDALNRLITTVAPDAGSTSLSYDSSDHLISHMDPISVTTQFIRNGFGDVIQEVSPDRGSSTYYYNEAGELTASIDGRGQRIDYTRDVLGRMTQKVPAARPASETITYTWDTAGIPGSYGVGRLSSITDGSGTTAFAYDHRGNLVTKRQTIGTSTADLAYAYDLADRVTQITYPSGRLVRYAYDTKGRVNQVDTKASASDPSWTPLASGLNYEPFGAVTTIALGNGLSVANDWGSSGQLVSRRLYASGSGANLSWLGYSYDANGNVGAVRDNLNSDNTILYGYDSNDRMTLASMVLDNAPLEESYSYAPGTNRLASLTDVNGTRSISYDDRGNTLNETRPGGVSVSTSYDGYGRLLSYARTGDPSQSNSYNGLDDRVGVTSGSVAHEFVYDADGRVMGEYGSSASDVVAETIWLSPKVTNNNQFGGDDGVSGYAPLAVATGSGVSAALTWLHGNHLGVPVTFTDASGAVVPAPSYSLPGFPGQTKTLSDIYYNRYRDYDSSLGRYIQADPIGLGGGNNPYLYADANPIRFTDPSGQFVPLVIAGVCWGGGCEALAALGIGAVWYWLHPITQPPENNVIPFPGRKADAAAKDCPNGDDGCARDAEHLKKLRGVWLNRLKHQDASWLRSYRAGAERINEDIKYHNARCPMHQVDLLPTDPRLVE